MERLRDQLRGRLPALLAAALLFAAVSPLLFTPGKLRNDGDFFQLATRHHLLRTAVLEEWSLPQWTPYLNGGFPSIADPEDPALSPFSLFTVAFGEIAGLKLIALFIFIVGCGAMFLLGSEVSGAGPPAAAAGAAVFGLSGWFITRLYSGNINELYYFLAPLIVLCLERLWSSGERKWGFYSAVLLAAIAMDGKTVFPVMLLFVGAYAAAAAFLRREGGISFCRSIPLGTLAVMAAAVVFASVKIIPVLGLFAEKGGIFAPVLASHQGAYADVVAFGWADFLRGLVLPGVQNRSVSLYLGAAPLLLAAVAMFCSFKKVRVWAITGLLFSLLWAGPHSPVDLLRLLWHLPFFGAISQPHKYFDFFVVFSVCAMVPPGFETIMRFLRAKSGRAAYFGAAVGAATLLPLVIFSVPRYARLFDYAPPEVSRTGFFQVKMARFDRIGLDMYFNALQNVGTINWYGAILMPAYAEPRFFVEPGKKFFVNPGYRGEAYCLEKENFCAPAYAKPNALGASVVAQKPGRLVFNQNYSRGWRSGYGPVENFGGLLSVEVRPSPYRQSVDLTYRSAGFYAGALISSAALLLALLFCFPSLRAGRRSAAGIF